MSWSLCVECVLKIDQLRIHPVLEANVSWLHGLSHAHDWNQMCTGLLNDVLCKSRYCLLIVNEHCRVSRLSTVDDLSFKQDSVRSSGIIAFSNCPHKAWRRDEVKASRLG